MVKLFCTITGVTRPFAVEIDANLSVDDLKKAIKKVVKPNGIRKIEEVPQLWRLMNLGGMYAIEQMDPFLSLNNPRYFGENFTPGNGHIHVLVVVTEIPTSTALDDLEKFAQECVLLAEVVRFC
ncbi:hypothetical protein L917_16562 [Phytophthora nicotianae]|uniref:Crinkler effector protein N-terminal domain-containing protein n=2 Tax=Phytophthora nicotianae TaxID=4792 RepID=W2KEF9_PHYNI|nr:hypothetical protein L915_16824 [Phytophthora nicotianae]ETL83498.1 hypothetical protein L917_16562 [Phytophthora nicotianae]ETO65343.1 hypothetical protein F444_17332 [Phytophthora nicotianae P1976]